MEKVCPICGKPTRVYMGNARKDGLCGTHADMLKAGEIFLCDKCGIYHKSGEDCNTERIKETKTEESKCKCLFCDNNTSDGYLFCKNCYYKYKDKSITVLVKNLSTFSILDEYGNRDVKTANGMYVRSQQEKIIYDELYSRNIKIEYEPTVYYKNEKGETEKLHPDFYLTDYNLYIEHWGYEDTSDKKYKEIKKFKEEIYKKENKRVAGTSSADIKDIKAAIDRIFFENDIKTN